MGNTYCINNVLGGGNIVSLSYHMQIKFGIVIKESLMLTGKKIPKKGDYVLCAERRIAYER